MIIDRRNVLLARLDALGRSLAQTPGALALIGLGSVGRESDRLDAYSDLDFFVIVEAGRKASFIDDLSWLSAAYPLSFSFRNTVDGYKFMFSDGVYGEMAVFTPDELETAAFSPGRLVWRREDVDEAIDMPRRWPPQRQTPDVEWHLGEALTNLYVGLARYRRGEKLSAFRFIQSYAVDRVIDLAALMAARATADEDLLDGPRRFEQRFPVLAAELPALMQGYERGPESAAAILTLLEAHFDLNETLTAAIRGLLSEDGA